MLMQAARPPAAPASACSTRPRTDCSPTSRARTASTSSSRWSRRKPQGSAMNPPIVAKTRRRGITFPAVLVLLVVASSAPAATAQIAVDELELRLSLRRGVAMSSESFHTANPSEKPAQVTISVQDWDRSEAGENRYYPLGTLPTSCASHIKVFPSVLQLDPRSVQTVRVALDSADALPRGCYAILFVETPPSPRATRGDAVTYSLRYGVKVYVEPEASPSAELDNIFLDRKPGDTSAKQLVIAYRN